MSRIARVVVPGLLHHVTQRGNNRELIFLTDEHRLRYVSLIRHYGIRSDVSILGFCLMSNHVHLVLKPTSAIGLAEMLRRAHAEYAQWFNKRSGRVGHLWQNRFFSCPLERAYVYNALRYVDLNPVRAGLVSSAWDWRWSSAQAHCEGRRDEFGLTAIEEMLSWRDLPDWLRLLGASDPEADKVLRAHTKQGRPVGSHAFIKELEAQQRRRLHALPSGRPIGRAPGNVAAVA